MSMPDPLLDRPTLITPPSIARRRQARVSGRSAAIAVVSTLVFFGLVVLVLFTAPGSASIRYAFFHPQFLAKALPQVGSAFLTNIRMFPVAEVLILTFAFSFVMIRTP